MDSLSKDFHCKDLAELQASLDLRSRKDCRPSSFVDMGPVGNTCLGLGSLAAATAIGIATVMDPLQIPTLIFAVPLALLGGSLVKREYSL